MLLGHPIERSLWKIAGHQAVSNADLMSSEATMTCSCFVLAFSMMLRALFIAWREDVCILKPNWL